MDCKLECPVPVKQPHVHVDRAVEQPSLEQDGLGFVRPPSPERELRVPALRRRDLLDAQHVLQLGDFVDGCERHLRRRQLLVGQRHHGQTRPERRILDVPAQLDGLLPHMLLDDAVQGRRVRRDGRGELGAVAAAHRDVRAVEVEDLGVLAELGRVARELGLVHEVAVDKHHVGVVPDDELAVHDRGQHVSVGVPRRRVAHRAQLERHHLLAPRRLAHRHYVQVPVPILEDALALRGAAPAVELHRRDVEHMLDRLPELLAARSVENAHQLRVRVVDHCDHVRAHAHRVGVDRLGPHPLEPRRGNRPPLVRVHLHAGVVDHQKVLLRQLNVVDRVLQVENVRRVEILEQVNTAL
mmetsp:Transcript_38486/g.90857  ORF Transcript_38486/g.90857 Transcript_38486/m.90857 type:complete len:354 (+) Transcript_38486:312-1373(+)